MVIVICVGVLSCVQLFVTQGTVALQAPLFMGFSRQEYWSGLSIFISRGIFPIQALNPQSVASPALADRFFTTVPLGIFL